MTVHNMKLNDIPFQSIKDGTKTIEMRLYDDKRRKVQVGDVIEFTHIDTKEKLRVNVIALHIYPSFEDLYNKFDKILLGYAPHEIALYTDMEQYYLSTEIQKYGVVGIELTLSLKVVRYNENDCGWYRLACCKPFRRT